MGGRVRQRQDARTIALDLLDRLDQGPYTLDRLIETTLDAHPELEHRDRALIFALVYGVQRWRSRLDAIAAHFASRSKSRIDPTVGNILRLALFQILFLDRIPAPAIVHTAVELAKHKAPRAARFVNGLLRNVLRAPLETLPYPPPDDPLAALAIEAAFPPWLLARWVARDGMETTRLRCAAANRIPALTVRVNRLQTNRRNLLSAWQPSGINAAPTLVSRDGILITTFHGPIRRLSGYEEGWFQVQDEAAQMVAPMVAPAPGQRILDACAGLGGKTGHLAALSEDRAMILATDRDRHKLADLTTEMQRLRITRVDTRTLDWLAGEQPEVGGPFDAVLLDAPCSGLGVIGRNPDTKWRRQKKDVWRNAERQLALVCALADQVKPGGALVYAVCSLEPEETEAVIGAFLDRRSDFFIQPPGDRLPSASRRLIGADGSVRIDPALEPMDGFFMVRLGRRQKAGRGSCKTAADPL